ncbi:MAG: hypothetical protein ABFR50_08055 [Candidatus Fermentibacteria bacterium]
MNCVQDSFRFGVPEIIYSIQENGRNWKLTSDSQKGILSLSVFGSEGNRYSILVMEKEHLKSDYAGKDGNWLLSESINRECNIRFNLEWAVEAEGSGCLVLCGRETPLPFNTSA